MVTHNEAEHALEVLSYKSPHESQQSVVRKQFYEEIIRQYITEQKEKEKRKPK